MGEDQVALESGRVTGGNLHAGKLAETGVYAVNGVVTPGRRRNPVSSLMDRPFRGPVDPHREFLAVDAFKVGKGHGTGGEGEGAHPVPPKMRFFRELKPIR